MIPLKNHVLTVYFNGLNNTGLDAYSEARKIAAATRTPTTSFYRNGMPDHLFAVTVNANGLALNILSFNPFVLTGTDAQSAFSIARRNQISCLYLSLFLEGYLNNHPFNRVLLVLHSQGIHKGRAVLHTLTEYAKRIKIITLGNRGIRTSDVFDIVNICQKKNWISSHIQPGANKSRNRKKNTFTFKGNDYTLSGYIKHPLVKTSLVSAIRALINSIVMEAHAKKVPVFLFN